MLDLSARKVYGALEDAVSAIDAKVDNAILSMYKAGGSLEFDDLPSPSSDVANMAYLVTDAFTTTSDFVEGAGVDYPAGTYVAIVNTGTEDDPDYKYDVVPFTMVVDDTMSAVSENPLQNKVITGAVQEIRLDISNLSASKISTSETVGHVMNDGSIDEREYAEKVENATSGHLAGLDSNGNLTDSGVSPTEDVTVEGNPVTFESPFEQDAKSVVVSVKPIQDLHGYDHPWVGGAGKNKCPYDNVSFTSANTWCNLEGGAASSLLQGSQVALKAGTYYISMPTNTNIDGMQVADSNENVLVNSKNGSFTLATDETIYIRIKQEVASQPTTCKIQIEAGSSATSWEPYSNICPISGIDEVEIGVSGKNLWNPDDTVSGFIDTDGSVRSYIGFSTTNYRECSANETYTLSYYRTDAGSADGTGMRIAWYDANKNFIRRDGYEEDHTVGLKQLSATAPANAVYMRTSMYTDVAYTENQQLELGLTPTDFEPYNPNSHTTTIPLPSTLYGGTVRVDEGSGTATRVIKQILSSDIVIASSTLIGRYLTDYNYLNDEKDHGEVICNAFKGMPYYSSDVIGECYISSNHQVCFVTSFATMQAFQDWIDNNPLYVCYELATPTTISLTPTDVELLAGTNVVSTNAEKVAVTYGRSLWQDIDKLKTDTDGKLDKSNVADVEGDTASKAYSVNDFMLRADGLYKVTQPIAQNASITSSNTTKTTIGAVLTALLNA